MSRHKARQIAKPSPAGFGLAIDGKNNKNNEKKEKKMAKYTYKEIKDLMKWTPKEWKGKELKDVNTCKTGAIYQGYFKKAAANWYYQVSTVLDADGLLVNVVTVFGHIVIE